MEKKYYTFVVFDEILDIPRKITISKKLFKCLVIFGSICFFVFTSSIAYFGHHYYTLSQKSREVSELKAESKFLKLKIQKFANKVNQFERQMIRLEKLDKKLRLITSIENSENNDSGIFGIGGSPEKRSNMIGLIPGTNTVGILSNRIEKLKAKANLRKISYDQLDRFLKGRYSYFNSTPSIWPVKGWVSVGFGYRISPFTGKKELHEGIDIASPVNSDILATADGIVVQSGEDSKYGMVIEIDHGKGIITKYANNSRNVVTTGEQVKRGQIVALIGNSERYTEGPHLHYEVIVNGIPVDPARYILEPSQG